MPKLFDAVRVIEAKPTIPYKFPYSFNTPTDMQCNSIPKLPDGVTLHMIKKQYNKIAWKLGIAIPFPEIEDSTDYTFLLLVLFVLVVCGYTFARISASTKSAVTLSTK